MKISCSFASQLDTPDNIKFAEELGYERAWCYDCPARFSDIWMTLARAAERTTRIGLGTAVITAGYREVMTNAAAIATLEALAPKRIVVGIGTGLGQASQGRKPTRLADLKEYVIALRGLLRGEEVIYGGKILKMMRDETDTVESIRDVPILLASEGPKTLELAEEICDGVLSLGTPRAGQEWSAVIINGTVVEDDDPNTRISKSSITQVPEQQSLIMRFFIWADPTRSLNFQAAKNFVARLKNIPLSGAT